jgi:hypothetical protein
MKNSADVLIIRPHGYSGHEITYKSHQIKVSVLQLGCIDFNQIFGK